MPVGVEQSRGIDVFRGELGDAMDDQTARALSMLLCGEPRTSRGVRSRSLAIALVGIGGAMTLEVHRLAAERTRMLSCEGDSPAPVRTWTNGLRLDVLHLTLLEDLVSEI